MKVKSKKVFGVRKGSTRLKRGKEVSQRKYYLNLFVLGLIIVVLLFLVNFNVPIGLVGFVISDEVVEQEFETGVGY